jgi:hypothetical protein
VSEYTQKKIEGEKRKRPTLNEYLVITAAIK